MKVLVIGKGGREHAICHKLSFSKYKPIIYCAPGNGGTRIYNNIDIKENDVNKLLEFALKEKIDLTIVGPEETLSLGIVDIFKKYNLKIFGPTLKASRIETSKEFMKNLMIKYNIPTAKYKVFTNFNDGISYLKEVNYPMVLKYDGLAFGKGVIICNNYNEAYLNLDNMLNKKIFGNSSVIIEEYLEGLEFSLMAFVNKDKIFYMDSVQDHKKAFDNNLGTNTGGMGCYSKVDFLNYDDLNESYKIMKDTCLALVKEDSSFTGILYGGLMKTDKGIKVIEFNCRFGDPETEVILPRLENDLIDVINDVLDYKDVNLKFKNIYTLGVVLASKGYPNKYDKGYEINIEDDNNINNLIYHMGTIYKNNKLSTNGGRVLICIGYGNTLKIARDNAYNIVNKINCDNLFYRKDIGFQGLKE